MGTPSPVFGVTVDAERAVADRRIARQLLRDALPAEYPAGDTMAGKHNAQPAGVEVEGRCIGAP